MLSVSLNKTFHSFLPSFQGEENTKRHKEEGQVVMVTEHRDLDGGNRRGHIVIRVSICYVKNLVQEKDTGIIVRNLD